MSKDKTVVSAEVQAIIDQNVAEALDAAAQTAIEVRKENAVMEAPKKQIPRGYEDEDEADIIIPRLKLIQDLSPERKDGSAAAGDIINSLTKEQLGARRFIPVFKYNNNIEWKPRSEGGGIVCRSMDGKVGACSDGSTKLCASCKRNEFDNSKTGKDAIPACTKYINFFGFIEESPIPVVLSFCKTYLNEGKKMFSLCKFTLEDMWNNMYYISSAAKSKSGNDWFALAVSPGGKTTEEQRKVGEQFYDSFRNEDLKVDLEDASSTEADSSIEIDKDIASEI